MRSRLVLLLAGLAVVSLPVGATADSAVKAGKEMAQDAEDLKAEQARREKYERSKRLPLPTDGYTWREAAADKKLAPAVVAALKRDKVAYGGSVRQSFVPYLGGPVFITSDSLLNAFQVLFESSFSDYERRQASELREKLEVVFRQAREDRKKSPFPAAETAPAWRRVQYVVGPALCLLGTAADFFDEDARPEIRREVERIRAAREAELPAWLAPADARLVAIDYETCKPVGFYAGDEKLADYFRAVRWLQLVPFRGDRREEVAAIGMLGDAVNQARHVEVESYFRRYAVMLGSSNGFGLPQAAFDFQNFFSARAGSDWAAELRRQQRWVLYNSISHEEKEKRPRGELPSESDPRLAQIVYHVLPSCLTADAALFQRLADERLDPEGLAVAMMLDSPLARLHLDHLTPEQVETAARLSHWAERKDHGDVPETSLYEDYLGVLRTLSASPEPDAPDFVRGKAWQAKSTQTILAGWAQMRHAFTLQATRSEVYFGITIVPPGFVEPNPEFFSRMADLVEKGRTFFGDNRDRWDTLASMSRELATLAHKELRRQPWSREEEIFLKTYGERIAGIMGYEGNSYEVPNDDAPRWAEVHHNAPENYSLAVAVGRPRLIYVLYPWNGLEILSQGSILPYYEYRSKERLTDAEWKQLLDSAPAPAPPAWLQPFLTK